VVPEFFQEAVTPQALGAALLAWLEDPVRVADAKSAFIDVHEQLRRGGADLAAEAVMEVVTPREGP
jgi:lipid-A-disaccharide synthase